MTEWQRDGEFSTDTLTWTDDNVLRHDPNARTDVERVDRNGAPELVYSDRPGTVLEVFEWAVDDRPDALALDFPGEDVTFTYAEWDAKARAISGALRREYGVESGDHVAIASNNRSAFPLALLGVMRAGAIPVVINARLAPRELEYVLSHSDPVHVIVGDDVLDSYRGADVAPPGETFVAGDAPSDYAAFEDLLDGDADGADRASVDSDDQVSAGPDDPASVDPDDPAFLMYTSGTTGRPKGALVSHHNVVGSVISFAVALEYPEDVTPRTLIAVPLFHVTGLVSQLLHILYMGGTSVVMESYDPDQFCHLIETRDVNFFTGVPAIYSLTLGRADVDDYDLDSWRVGMFGGAAMAPETISTLREKLPRLSLQNAYGATETASGPVTAMLDRCTDDRPESVGIPVPTAELKVVDDDGEALPPGEPGELAIRGSFIVDGYYDNDEANAGNFDGGWFLSGDVAEIGEDGFVQLKGREKQMITRGGENVYPLEVENALATHPDVLEVSVTGVDDAVLGSRVLAAVVPEPDARLTEGALRDHVADRLADYKQPELYRILDELPKTASGKVSRDRLVPPALQYGIGAGHD